MRSEKYKKINNWLPVAFFFLLLISYFLLLIFSVACGRRGDPVAILPYEEKADEKIIDESKKDSSKELDKVLIKHNESERGEIEVNTPDSPTGLIAVYTQKSIVLTWDETISQGVKLYKIYRSTGDDYILVGDTVTPAFTDNNVEQNIKYYYKVTAVGTFESPPSKEIEIETEVH